jgi:hypothetical protein
VQTIDYKNTGERNKEAASPMAGGACRIINGMMGLTKGFAAVEALGRS